MENKNRCQLLWGRERENHKFEVILGYKGGPCLKRKPKGFVGAFCFHDGQASQKPEDLVVAENVTRNIQGLSRRICRAASRHSEEMFASKACFYSSVGAFLSPHNPCSHPHPKTSPNNSFLDPSFFYGGKPRPARDFTCSTEVASQETKNQDAKGRSWARSRSPCK